MTTATATRKPDAAGRLAVATEIHRQMGGQKMAVMTGAYGFLGDENSLTFRFKMCKKANSCKVTLNGLDLYDVEFFRIRKRRGQFEIEMPKTGEFNG